MPRSTLAALKRCGASLPDDELLASEAFEFGCRAEQAGGDVTVITEMGGWLRSKLRTESRVASP
jgi:hypothetical protein